jgi:hypothetical protein
VKGRFLSRSPAIVLAVLRRSGSRHGGRQIRIAGAAASRCRARLYRGKDERVVSSARSEAPLRCWRVANRATEPRELFPPDLYRGKDPVVRRRRSRGPDGGVAPCGPIDGLMSGVGCRKYPGKAVPVRRPVVCPLSTEIAPGWLVRSPAGRFRDPYYSTTVIHRVACAPFADRLRRSAGSEGPCWPVPTAPPHGSAGGIPVALPMALERRGQLASPAASIRASLGHPTDPSAVRGGATRRPAGGGDPVSGRPLPLPDGDHRTTPTCHFPYIFQYR